MFSLLLGRINPASFDLSQLLLHFTLVMIGGLGSLVGSVAGAILLTARPEVLRNIAGVEEIVFSLLLIVVLLFIPKGLAGLLSLTRLPRERLYLDQTMPLLRVETVSLNFGGLAALNLCRNRNNTSGDCPNGAGKTSLFNAISGYERQRQGTIRLGETVVTGQPPRRIRPIP
jgi:hypothetical protein